ncbi:YncE family protein (plasmid) [Bacillus mycoides]|uniref:YncE family protein n=2 Tax=Bacillus mycoides TaxID=1405 RepID=UPI0023515A76|nr:hypothetical protein [Bacillus mycoides]
MTPDGSSAYVTNSDDSSVSVINTFTNTVIGAPIHAGNGTFGIVITPDGSRAYVANEGYGSVSVINTITNTVIGAPIPVGVSPEALVITPDGSRVYVAKVKCRLVRCVIIFYNKYGTLNYFIDL